MGENLVEFFSRLELTREYSVEEINRLAAGAKLISFANDQAIIKEGHQNSAIYFIFSGEAEVLKHDEYSGDIFPINVMRFGSLFGEMSELTGEPASATVRAKGDCQVVMIERIGDMSSGLHSKLLLSCSGNLIKRLRRLSERQAELMGREAKKEREKLQTTIAQKEKALAARTVELIEAQQHLNDVLLNQYDINGVIAVGEFIGRSPLMRHVFDLIRALAESDITVLITGETGAGKGMIAAAIHQTSRRKKEPFVSLNCTALNDELLGSELFGHRKGAFTGALEDRVGRFQAAKGGTIFLDEIGDISPRMQSYLLRILETGEYERLGDSKTINSDARIIAATNRDLKQKVAEGRFREDLYYRLNVMSIETPPLRDRPEDIPLLLDHFRVYFNRQMNRSVESLSETAFQALTKYSWPGNVRELRNTVERSILFCHDPVLQLIHLPFEFRSLSITSHRPGVKSSEPTNNSKSDKLNLLQADRLLQALRESAWNVSKVAEEFGVSRTHLYRLFRKYRIKRGKI